MLITFPLAFKRNACPRDYDVIAGQGFNVRLNGDESSSDDDGGDIGGSGWPDEGVGGDDYTFTDSDSDHVRDEHSSRVGYSYIVNATCDVPSSLEIVYSIERQDKILPVSACESVSSRS